MEEYGVCCGCSVRRQTYVIWMLIFYFFQFISSFIHIITEIVGLSAFKQQMRSDYEDGDYYYWYWDFTIDTDMWTVGIVVQALLCISQLALFIYACKKISMGKEIGQPEIACSGWNKVNSVVGFAFGSVTIGLAKILLAFESSYADDLLQSHDVRVATTTAFVVTLIQVILTTYNIIIIFNDSCWLSWQTLYGVFCLMLSSVAVTVTAVALAVSASEFGFRYDRSFDEFNADILWIVIPSIVIFLILLVITSVLRCRFGKYNNY